MKATLRFAAVLVASSAFGQAPPAEPLSSVVAIKAKSADGETSRVGIVLKGNRVATTLGWVRDFTDVQVITSDGAAHNAQGIISYNVFSNAALIAVDWGGAAPPAAELAKSIKPDTTGLKVCHPAEAHGQPLERVDAQTTWVRGGWIGIDAHGKIDVDWGGAPVLSETGALLGIISGSQGTSTSMREVRGLYATRAEMLGALQEVPIITWKDWPASMEKFTKAERLARESSALARRADYDEALVKAKESVELDPRCSFAWQMVACIYLHRNQEEDAIDACRKSIGIDPCDMYPYGAIAGCCARLGRTEEAIRMIDRAVAINPRDYRVFSMKGYVLEHAQQEDEAIAAYKEAVRLNPEDNYSLDAIERLSASPEPGARKPRSSPKW